MALSLEEELEAELELDPPGDEISGQLRFSQAFSRPVLHFLDTTPHHHPPREMNIFRKRRVDLIGNQLVIIAMTLPCPN